MDKSVSIRPYTIVGSTESKDAFSRVFLYQPVEEEVLTTRGELFVIFSAAVPGLEIDWEKVAIQSFNFLRDTYYRSISGGVLQTLEEALDKTREEFNRLISEYIPEGQFPTIDLHLGALVVWGGTYLFRSSGKVFFALYRNNELVDYSQDRFVQEAIAEGDALVLGTAVFGERVGTSVVKKVLESELSDDWQRLIRQEVQDVEQNALLSGIILSVLIEAQAGEEEVIEIIMPGETTRSSKLRSLPKIQKPSGLPSVKIPGGGLGGRIATFFHAIRAKFAREDIYVKKSSTSRPFKKWLLVLVFVSLLAGSIYYTSQRNKTVVQEEQQQA
ncbi:hypothetical protein KC573_03935, partial [candidate division WWE3 bacterium]|nr:hypothetical protein [candidate division WWE3 bacterium]